ncbi:transglycosylase domain-containing protein [Arthrobacter sp. zg-Y1110]|uniref:transglycosylase domain-containing protein n=1 Tax=Arthrobacter sp. zg-Y1110 TaxID=2886932 RepID=UPI001D140036|nr:transglycosylase domain-containing protein [Arthrobacter sp. zg-Y1110]MCC3292863.1 transglycosylase domain-containing protein [Arthrobacter sp. zg-Y1110]UWX86801.1 transglycosylase domain-containing protein [Arthrobacter sp. zg-Y1110]
MNDPRHEPATLDSLLGEPDEDTGTKKPRGRRLGAFAGAVAIVALAAGSLIAPAATFAAGAASSALNYWEDLPTELPLDVALPQHTVLLDKNGKEFARFYSENRIDVKLEDISEHFTQALVATEDVSFYENGGADVKGITRAAVANLISDSTQGASTITQQLVQNILLNNARDETEAAVGTGTSYNAKLREIKYAVNLEKQLSKDEILNSYANTVYFGQGAYGVEAASKIYFGTSAKDLTSGQAALLVGLVKGPNIYDPYTAPELAKNRRDTVLHRLAAVGDLTPAELEAAVAEPLGILPEPGKIRSGCDQSDYPFYCSLVRKEILDDPAFGDTREAREDRLTRGGMTLTTALDPKVMNSSQQAVDEALGAGNRGALGVAVVIPGTGKIVGIAQNREWGAGDNATEMVYADQAFQPGSTMKPIALATALEQGIPATTRFNAVSPYVPAALDFPDGGYINYGGTDWGVIDARGAIKVSSNTYFIQLVERTGVLSVADMSARLGITTLPRTGERAIQGREASLVLGAYEVSPIELANAYATFAAAGVECTPHAIVSGIRTSSGESIPTPDADCHQAIAPAVANTVGDALKMPFTSGGTLESLGGLAGRESGAKTGTTNDYAANWIAGITPQYSTAVWLGDPRGGSQHPLTVLQAYGQTFYNLTGSEVAAPVWKSVMNGIHQGLPAKPMPKADDAATSSTTASSIPDVRGMGTDEAVTLLLANKLTPVISETTAKASRLHPKDTVVSQTPAPGSTSGYRQEVVLTLSSGSTTAITLPEGK